MPLDRKKFDRLPLALRYKTVEEKGNYIMLRRHRQYTIELFQLNGQYVEVWRSMATNQIQSIDCRETDYVVEKYTAQLDLGSFFS